MQGQVLLDQVSSANLEDSGRFVYEIRPHFGTLAKISAVLFRAIEKCWTLSMHWSLGSMLGVDYQVTLPAMATLSFAPGKLRSVS
jgi:hypothetical protein